MPNGQNTNEIVTANKATAIAKRGVASVLANRGGLGLPVNFNIEEAIKTEVRNMQIQADPNATAEEKQVAANFSGSVALNMLEGMDNPVADRIRQQLAVR